MVQLKGVENKVDNQIKQKFQFLNGTIKRTEVLNGKVRFCMFQFLNGTIKRILAELFGVHQE